MRYANGQIPEHALEELGSGWDQDGQWKHLATPGTAVRWRWMVGAALQKYGLLLRITPGWNVFRPLRMQFIYRERLGIMAAWPGTSSHGGVFDGRDCMAIDVQNWDELAPGNIALAWARFQALCRLAGFTTDFVTPRERWHIGDFDPWNVPAWMEDDMYTDADRARDNQMAADVAWIKRRVGGSVNDMTLAASIQWIRTRVGGSVNNMNLTSLSEWIKSRIGGSVQEKTITDEIRDDSA